MKKMLSCLTNITSYFWLLAFVPSDTFCTMFPYGVAKKVSKITCAKTALLWLLNMLVQLTPGGSNMKLILPN
jgi:hypothetical protein